MKKLKIYNSELGKMVIPSSVDELEINGTSIDELIITEATSKDWLEIAAKVLEILAYLATILGGFPPIF